MSLNFGLIRLHSFVQLRFAAVNPCADILATDLLATGFIIPVAWKRISFLFLVQLPARKIPLFGGYFFAIFNGGGVSLAVYACARPRPLLSSSVQTGDVLCPLSLCFSMVVVLKKPKCTFSVVCGMTNAPLTHRVPKVEECLDWRTCFLPCPRLLLTSGYQQRHIQCLPWDGVTIKNIQWPHRHES